MLTNHNYTVLPAEWDKAYKTCCSKPGDDTPGGSDCCYDKWVVELKEVNKKYKDAEEEAKQKAAEFAFVSERRDQFKKWVDEMDKATLLHVEICNQMEIFIDQTDKVGINTQHTVDAIKILFCMIRDYYIQLDMLREKYDDVLDCIKCINNSALASGTGLMKVIEDYGVKLTAAQASGINLLKMVMEALSLAEKIDLNIGPDYGLLTVLDEWKKTFKCAAPATTGTDNAGNATQDKKYENETLQVTNDTTAKPCKLTPVLEMPIKTSQYYIKVKGWYEADVADADSLATALLGLNKTKESMLSCKQSLESAIKEVDPKTRCKA